MIINILDKSSSCKNLQQPTKLNIENKYWQVLHTSNGTFKMFNAYYDHRNFFKNDPVIRILTFYNRVKSGLKTHCQLWFDGVEEPIIAEIHRIRIIWNDIWGYNYLGSQPHLIACRNPLAAEGLIPSSVSLVENPCEHADNNLKIINNQVAQKKPFAVCVKQLEFVDDETMKIIEWIEILLIMGVDKIFIYVIKLHPNMMRALKYYESRGKIKIEMIAEPKGLPSKEESLTQWTQNELISLNDCLYKHMNEYDYLVPLDIDEVIIPKRSEDRNWNDLLNRTKARANFRPFSAYVARNVFFLSDNIHENETQAEVPKDFHFLQHVYRASNFSEHGVGVKTFQDTERVLAMHNHFPMYCIGKNTIDFKRIDESDGQLQHYRRGCDNYSEEECDDYRKNTVKDLSLWRHKDEIVSNVKRSLEELKNFEV